MKRKDSFIKKLKAAFAAATLGILPISASASPAPETPTPASAPFVPTYYTGESCPAETFESDVVRPSPSFSVSPREQQRLLESIGFVIGREKPDGQFTERTLQSINEFRLLKYGNVPFAESLTAKELEDLRVVSSRVAGERKTYKMTLDNATALRFAATRTIVKHASLVTTTNKGQRKFQSGSAEWMYLIKTHGDKYGLGYFADHINLEQKSDGVYLSVQDPAIFEQVMALQGHARISRIMQAEEIDHKASMPAIFYQQTLPPVADLLTKQQDLITLGFDVGGADGQQGPMTEAALKKFEILYGPLLEDDVDALEYIAVFAKLARMDAEDHNISSGAAAAIRLANLRTGLDFGYLMELSSAESGFDPEAKAGTSSATGLYQFTEDTWLQTVNRYGDQYGMKDLADQIDAKNDMYGTFVARVENPFVRVSALELRKDPHFAALMSAEFQLRNKFRIECAVGKELGRTEQYLGHFLGAKGAISFIKQMMDNPDASAPAAFPTAAGANKNIFYKRNSQGKRIARSLEEVFNVLGRKFDRDQYEETNTVQSLALNIQPRKFPPTPPT